MANGTGIPLTCSTHSTERAEVKLVSETVDQARYPEVPPPLIADKGYGSDELRDELAETNFLLISPHRQIANAHLAMLAKGCVDTCADGSLKNDFLARAISPIRCAVRILRSNLSSFYIPCVWIYLLITVLKQALVNA